MRRTVIPATILVLSVVGCNRGDAGANAAGTTSAKKGYAYASYEILPSADSTSKGGSVHDLLIHGVAGTPDSIVNDTTHGLEIIIFGVGTKADSVSNSGTPHIVGPSPRMRLP